MSNISTTKKSFIFFLILQIIFTLASSSPSIEKLSCCDRIHLVGSSSGAIHPPGKSIHASKHPCTAQLYFPPGSHWPAGLLTWLWLAAPFCHLPLRPARVSISGMRAGYINKISGQIGKPPPDAKKRRKNKDKSKLCRERLAAGVM